MTGLWRVVEGDCVDVLRGLEAGSVQTCITSPPYFGLRDYGTGRWEGGDESCDHLGPPMRTNNKPSDPNATFHGGTSRAYEPWKDGVCGRCGATRVDSQIGLEPTPDEYVQALVTVFREVWRVLRDDGTLWLNLGDSYAGSGGFAPNAPTNVRRREQGSGVDGAFRFNQATLEARQPERHGLNFKGKPPGMVPDGCKPKDLLGIPWAVAFALRADGWYLRSDIIWAKPNPMPESVTDRPTKSHEYLFLLSKQPRYFYDADAIREDAVEGTDLGVLRSRAVPDVDDRVAWHAQSIRDRQDAGVDSRTAGTGRRNKRSVWTVPTQPFPGAHFAVFPPKLIEPCVLAGSSERACGVCGAPWRRIVERETRYEGNAAKAGTAPEDIGADAKWAEREGNARLLGGPVVESRTIGWEPSCDHQDDTGSCVVLDPFAGAGTTGVVATRHGRGFVGIELNPVYAEMARQRIRDDAPLFNYLGEAA